MLVLTRKYQEKIRIGNNITITVLRTKGKAVRLGIEAPEDVPVIRGELAFETEEAIAPAKEEATSGHSSSRRNRADAGQAWPVESPQVAARSTSDRVEHQRVPRNKVADVLPQIAGSTAPLRSLMRRS